MFNSGYFKGWYFKCSTGDSTIAFIPAYHCSNKKETASLQVITEDSAFSVPFLSLQYREKPLSVRIGNCVFSENGIQLDIREGTLSLSGTLCFEKLSPIRYPIMGPFRFVPFMQCRHSVYSMRHRINGHITIGGRQLDFRNGIGYIEGDRGRSFPKRYVWTQCCFENGSLMLSVADIPFCGGCFTGVIGVMMLDGKEYRIATYCGARVSRIGENTVTVKQGDYRLTATLLCKNAQPLAAPRNGNMSRTIHESSACKAYYRFSCKNEILCEFTSDNASFEFEYEKEQG